MSLDQETWREIARLWSEGHQPLGKIAERYGISHQKITAHARREGWSPRGGRKRPRSSGGDADSTASARSEDNQPTSMVPVRTSKTRGAARRAMAERWFEAMENKLSAIEARMAAGGDNTAVDSERTTRTLNTLVRSLEKLSDYEGKITGRSGRKNGKRPRSGADAERRRQELAARIQRLLQCR